MKDNFVKVWPNVTLKKRSKVSGVKFGVKLLPSPGQSVVQRDGGGWSEA